MAAFFKRNQQSESQFTKEGMRRNEIEFQFREKAGFLHGNRLTRLNRVRT